MNKFKAGDKVTCSEVPGKDFEVVECIGEGEVAQYMLKDENGTHYGYVGADELRQEGKGGN